jgi:osmotically-inducible protein OsmY
MHKLNRTLVVLAAAALLGLGGCATTGGNNFFDDSMVTASVKKAIYDEPSLKITDISVSTDGGVVSLSGSVKTRAERVRAAEVARRVEGVKRVNNDLKVGQKQQ